MASKYKQYFDMMFEQNKVAFENFKDIHDHYVLEPKKWQKIYNEYGKEILEIIHEWENRLCGKSEGSGYGRYSGNLADKFKSEVKKYLPKLDYIGVTYE